MTTRRHHSVVANVHASGPKLSQCHCSPVLRGTLLTLLGAVSLALAALLVKVCSEVLSTLDVLWGRALLQTAFVGFIFLTRCSSPWGPRHLRGWLSLRGILGCCSVVGYFMGIIALPLSDAISIYSVKPIFAAFLGACVLGESLGCIHALATGLSLLGCVVVAKAEHGTSKSKLHGEVELEPWIAVTLLLLAALMAAGTTITTRRVMARTSLAPEIPVWYFCFMDLLLLGIITPFVYHTSFSTRSGEITLRHWLSLIGVAAFSVLGQQLFTLGLRHIPSALSTLLLQMETVDAFILQILFVGRVSGMSCLGAGLICLGICSLALYELRGASNDSDSESSPLETVETVETSDVEATAVGHSTEGA